MRYACRVSDVLTVRVEVVLRGRQVCVVNMELRDGNRGDYLLLRFISVAVVHMLQGSQIE